MKSFLSRRVLISAMIASTLMAAGSVAAQNVAGLYRAEGRNPDGSSYSGKVQIRENGGEVQINWQVGSQSYSGSGTRNGDVIWVNWGDTYPVVYVRMPSGELHGTWANGRGLERLIP